MDKDKSWRRILCDPVGIDGMLPLHVAIQNGALTDLILKMIEKYPDSVTKESDANGLTSLHVAAFIGCSLEVLEALLKHAPGVIGSKRGAYKNTPLHLLFHLQHQDHWVKKEKGMMPPHEMVRHLIKVHAYHLKTIQGKVKNKANDTVLGYANQLKEKLSPACWNELLTLLEAGRLGPLKM